MKEISSNNLSIAIKNSSLFNVWLSSFNSINKGCIIFIIFFGILFILILIPLIIPSWSESKSLNKLLNALILFSEKILSFIFLVFFTSLFSWKLLLFFFVNFSLFKSYFLYICDFFWKISSSYLFSLLKFFDIKFGLNNIWPFLSFLFK